MMEKELMDQQERIINTEQHSRNVNFEMKGIPNAENENVYNIVTKITSLVAEEIKTDDLDTCHRVPTKRGDTSHITV